MSWDGFAENADGVGSLGFKFGDSGCTLDPASLLDSTLAAEILDRISVGDMLRNIPKAPSKEVVPAMLSFLLDSGDGRALLASDNASYILSEVMVVSMEEGMAYLVMGLRATSEPL
jgi:hypothetical protein